VAIFLERVYHRQPLMLNSGVVLFSFGQSSTCEHDQVINSFCSFLREYSTQRDTRRINMDMKFDVPFWENQNGSRHHFLLENLYTFLTIIILIICSIFLQQLFHWCRDLCIALNKLTIVADVSQRGAELFDTVRCLQIDYDNNIRLVHHQALFAYHMAEKFPEGDKESTFL